LFKESPYTIGAFVYPNTQKKMNVTFLKDDLGVGTLTLDFTDADFAAEYKKRLRQYAAKANVKGFRPGKVPEQLVEKMYGEGLKAEALNDKVSETINSYLKDNNVQILGEIHNKDHHVADPKAKEFSLSYEMALVPEFTLPDLSTIELPKFNLQFTEEQARQEIDSFRKRSGKLQEQEVADDSSIIYAEFEQAGAEPKKTYLSAERMTDAGKAAFLGRKKDDEVTLVLEEAFSAEELRKVLFLSNPEDVAPQGKATFKVERIQNFALPELDQIFVEERLGVEYSTNEADVIKAYQAKMAVSAASGVEYVEQSKALAILSQKVDIKLPEAFLKHMVEHTYQHENRTLTDEEFSRELRGVRNNLLLDKLAETLEVQVDFEDVVSETMQAIVGSGYYNGGMQDEELRNMAIKLLSQKDRSVMNDMAGRARSGKILGAVAAKMARVEKSVTHEELQDIANSN
jgi:trigger factor